MTDRDALLAAVLAYPADDTPRLVFADWLQEHDGDGPCVNCRGEGRLWWERSQNPGYESCRQCSGTGRASNGNAERAEFIRVQCELARLEVIGVKHCVALNADRTRDPGEPDGHEAERIALRRRERELLASPNWERWAGASPLCDRPQDLGWSRGFVSSVTCPAADWLAHGDALTWRPGQTVDCGYHHREPYCTICRDTGRVPRPCPPTAQPVERVRLTTRPELVCQPFHEGAASWWLPGRNYMEAAGDPPDDGITLRLLRQAWPGVEFEIAGR